MTVSKWFVFLLTVVSFCSCKETKKDASHEKSLYLSGRNADSLAAYNEFNSFIDRFSTDSIFQLNRVKFPLRVEQFVSENLKDTVFYLERSSFEIGDFRKERSTAQFDQWKRNVVIDKGNTKATIEIRGIDNGIYLDYHFQKKNGKWLLESVNDSST